MVNHQDIFSRRFAYALEKRGIDIAGLAQKTGLARKTLYAYRLGDRIPTFDNLVLIGKTLHVSLDWLCGMRVKEDGNA